MFRDWYLSAELLSFDKSENKKRAFRDVKISNIHFPQLHLTNSSPKNTFTFFDYISNCKNLLWWQRNVSWAPCVYTKSQSIVKMSKLITNCTNKEIPQNTEQFPKKILVWKYKAYTVPKNTGIPGFCKNTVPYRTGMKFLIPLGPGWDPQF